MLNHYIKLWWIYTVGITQITFQSRFGASVFLLGKIIRFALFLFFLIVLVGQTKTIAGYSLWQIIFFYATFNLLDTLPQFFFRNVYRFRYQVITGYYDNLLTKPMPSLFHPLFGGSDVLDLFILVASIFFIVFSGTHLDNINSLNIFIYILLLANGFLIATALHIFVLGFGILTTAVDNMIMLYRDLTQMGRLPIEIYHEPLRGILTFIVPVGIMMTFPTKAILGLLSLQGILIAFVIGIVLFIMSMKFWNYSLKQYGSASS